MAQNYLLFQSKTKSLWQNVWGFVFITQSTIKCIIKQFSFWMDCSFEVYNPIPHKYGPGLNGFLTLKKLKALVRFEVAVLYRNVLAFACRREFGMIDGNFWLYLFAWHFRGIDDTIFLTTNPNGSCSEWLCYGPIIWIMLQMDRCFPLIVSH